jgi:hypothetical protein
VSSFSLLHSKETFPKPGVSGYQDVGVDRYAPDPDGKLEERWDNRVTALNEGADRVAAAYDALMDRARIKLQS